MHRRAGAPCESTILLCCVSHVCHSDDSIRRFKMILGSDIRLSERRALYAISADGRAI